MRSHDRHAKVVSPLERVATAEMGPSDEDSSSGRLPRSAEDETSGAPAPRHPNPLFRAISESDWDAALLRCARYPSEVTHWEVLSAEGAPPVRTFALHLACALDPPAPVVRALIGADFDAVVCPDGSGRRPLHSAAEAASPDVVDALLRPNPDGARVRERRHGCLPLHFACGRGAGRDGSGEETARVVGRLLEVFPEGTLCRDSQRGWLPLHVAARSGAPTSVISMLLRTCPKAAMIGDDDQRLLIHFVCRYADKWEEEQLVGALEALIQSYPEGLKRREGKAGFTPLHIACSALRPPVALVSTLLKHGKVATSIPDYSQCLPLHVAVRSKSPCVILRSLLEANPLTAMDGDKNERIPLHWACHTNAPVNRVKTLLRFFLAGAGVSESKYGFTPLHIAVQQNADVGVIATLLSCYPNAARVRDKNGSLPIHLCCKNIRSDSPTVVGMLVHAYPESLIVKDHKGRRPVDLARLFRGHELKSAMVEMLLVEEEP